MGSLRRSLGPISVVIGILGVIVLVSAGALYLLLPQLEASAQALAVLGLILLLIFLVAGFELLRGAVLARQARYGTNTLIMVVAFFAIAVIVNFLGARFHQRFDTTASGQFTLSLHTQTVLNNLKDDIKVVGFFKADDPEQMAGREAARNLLNEYSNHSAKLTYEFVDPEEKPNIAREYEVRDDGALVFTDGGRKQQIFGIGEQEFTGAILNVTGIQQKSVYFLSGHGEPDINSADDSGLKLARQGLETDNYKVDTFDFTTSGGIPKDASVIVVVAPKRALEQNEVQGIEAYLNGGGQALFLLEPNPSPEIQGLLKKYGLNFRAGLVVDTDAYALPNVFTPAVLRDQYLASEVTKGLDTTVFPGATAIFPIVPDDDKKSIALTPLAHTSFRSWQTVTNNTESVPTFQPDKDTIGPLILAAQVEAIAPIGGTPKVPAGPNGPKATHIVAVGDSDFATNKYFYSKNNSDFFLNSVNWLGAQEELISIRPKPPQFRRLIITARAWNWILYSSIGFLPGVVLLAGGVVWWRRR